MHNDPKGRSASDGHCEVRLLNLCETRFLDDDQIVAWRYNRHVELPGLVGLQCASYSGCRFTDRDRRVRHDCRSAVLNDAVDGSGSELALTQRCEYEDESNKQTCHISSREGGT